MKYVIASDIHGSALYCRALLDAYKVEEADRLILLGDLLYHGPRNDLPEGYDPKAVIALLNALNPEILCVRGNCEAEVDQMVLDFPVMADYALMELGGRTVFLTHGHLYNEGCLPPLCPGDILLHGHTHVTACRKVGEIWYLNPGSVSIPKEGTPRGYIVLEDGTFTFKTLTGETQLRFSPEE